MSVREVEGLKVNKAVPFFVTGSLDDIILREKWICQNDTENRQPFRRSSPFNLCLLETIKTPKHGVTNDVSYCQQ